MTSVHFDFGGRNATYTDFYNGFGLTCTVYLLFSAFLAWHLGALAQTAPQAIGMLGWAFLATQVIALVITGFYFALVPTIFSAAAAISLALGAWLVRSQRQVMGHELGTGLGTWGTDDSGT